MTRAIAVNEYENEYVDWEKLDEMSDVDLSDSELYRLGRTRGNDGRSDEDDLDDWLDDDDE